VKFNGTVIKCLGLNYWGSDVVSVLVIEMLGKKKFLGNVCVDCEEYNI